jgi:site-specific recombinase XerD
VRLTDAVALFVNVEGNRLSRFGLRYIIAHRVAEAAKSSPTLLTRNVTPHTIRHTTATDLVQSDVDLNMIRSWLGHASIETTNTYVEIDFKMKRKTLQSSEKLLPKKGKHGPSWQRKNDILSWLSEL